MTFEWLLMNDLTYKGNIWTQERGMEEVRQLSNILLKEKDLIKDHHDFKLWLTIRVSVHFTFKTKISPFFECPLFTPFVC